MLNIHASYNSTDDDEFVNYVSQRVGTFSKKYIEELTDLYDQLDQLYPYFGYEGGAPLPPTTVDVSIVINGEEYSLNDGPSVVLSGIYKEGDEASDYEKILIKVVTKLKITCEDYWNLD